MTPEIKDEMREPYIYHHRKGTLIDYHLALLEYTIDRFSRSGSDLLKLMAQGTR